MIFRGLSKKVLRPGVQFIQCALAFVHHSIRQIDNWHEKPTTLEVPMRRGVFIDGE